MLLPREEHISHELRNSLAELPDGADIVVEESQPFQMVLSDLQFFIPNVLREIHPEWLQESLDGVQPMLARKIEEAEVEIFGMCILITDQTMTPLHLRLQLALSKDEVSWLECRLGEKGPQGMVRVPYPAHQLWNRLYVLNPERREDQIEWEYHVTFGERRC